MADKDKFKPRSGKDRRSGDPYTRTRLHDPRGEKRQTYYKTEEGGLSEERRQIHADKRGVGPKRPLGLNTPEMMDALKGNLAAGERKWQDQLKQHREANKLALNPETGKAIDAFIKKYRSKHKDIRGEIIKIKSAKFGNRKVLDAPMRNIPIGKITKKLLKGGGWLGLGAALGAAARVGMEAYKKDKEKK